MAVNFFVKIPGMAMAKHIMIYFFLVESQISRVNTGWFKFFLNLFRFLMKHFVFAVFFITFGQNADHIESEVDLKSQKVI